MLYEVITDQHHGASARPGLRVHAGRAADDAVALSVRGGLGAGERARVKRATGAAGSRSAPPCRIV